MRPSNPYLNLLLWVLLSFVTLFPIYWLFVISVKPAVDRAPAGLPVGTVAAEPLRVSRRLPVCDAGVARHQVDLVEA
jgi:ABC-type glycerol-3-phosphate transport system permease component